MDVIDVLYLAYEPSSQGTRLGWSGYIEDPDGFTSIGWHSTAAEARQALEQLIANHGGTR
jgi:hypothetical protein